jgi:hypothetical protein
VGKLKERDVCKYPSLERRTILKAMLEEHKGRAWTGLIWQGLGPFSGCCQHGNELPVSIKWEKFFEERKK